ncbi:ATPase [Streptomyces spongiae]|uniref:ATPase n=1 Tax=Streptomyces spongiae TaxID=565072 RepID=A0A5N8XGQ6_9ACTN|nr:ATPase [Streptomyces spongiae]
MDQAVRLLALGYTNRLDELKQHFVGRDEVVDLLGLASLCQEHILVIGPPGTAKTGLLDRFCQMLDTRPFHYLLTRFTEPAELFGPLNIERFQQESVFEVNTEGMLPEARMAFLDEVFQGSSAILNTLLTLINERTFHTGRKIVRTPLITLVGSSNEIPADPVLAAFSDRFLLRCTLDYVKDDEVDDVLTLGWRNEQGRIARDPLGEGDGRLTEEDRTRVSVSPHDLRTLQRAVADVDVSDIRRGYTRILQDFRAEGIAFSDRRAVRAQKVFAASALLAGRGRAAVSDLAHLVHLWTDPRDEPSIRRIVADHGVPVQETGVRIRELFEILQVDLQEIVARRDQADSREQLHELMRRTQRLAAELRRDHPAEHEALRTVQREQRTTVELFRELYGDEGLY